MGLCKNAVNLGFGPVSNGLAWRNRDNTSPEQEEKGNYDESKTDGNIQKPWQCEHSIAVYRHLQMELYRLMSSCVFM
ncbi:MAG: hypothetical protein RJA02_770 [Armatimonadota bacterium]|jgi:hypothetical protein